jgi:hypothetical protein
MACLCHGGNRYGDNGHVSVHGCRCALTPRASADSYFLQAPAHFPLLVTLDDIVIGPLIFELPVELNEVGVKLPVDFIVIRLPPWLQTISVVIVVPTTSCLVNVQLGLALSISCGPRAASSGEMQTLTVVVLPIIDRRTCGGTLGMSSDLTVELICHLPGLIPAACADPASAIRAPAMASRAITIISFSSLSGLGIMGSGVAGCVLDHGGMLYAISKMLTHPRSICSSAARAGTQFQ